MAVPTDTPDALFDEGESHGHDACPPSVTITLVPDPWGGSPYVAQLVEHPVVPVYAACYEGKHVTGGGTSVPYEVRIIGNRDCTCGAAVEFYHADLGFA